MRGRMPAWNASGPFSTQRTSFYICSYTSLTVQEVEISKEHEDGEKWWFLIGPQSLKGVALVQLSQCR